MEYRLFVGQRVEPGTQPIFQSVSNQSEFDAFRSGPLLIRHLVFVVEQRCNPLLEVDEEDCRAVHILGSVGGTIVGTARAFDYGKGRVKIGRMAILEEHRGQGYGRGILQQVEEAASRTFGCDVYLLNAQKDKMTFYSSCGYTWDESEGEWDEEGMMHVRMFKRVIK